MILTTRLQVSAALLAAAALPVNLTAQKHKIKPTVPFAKTWEAAVQEAKLLNLPIVVHSHGFY